jgi:ZIP family zinc transporter
MFTAWTPLQLGLAGALVAAAFTGLGASLSRVRPALSLHPALSVVAGLLMIVSIFSLGLPAGKILDPSIGDLQFVALVMGGMLLGGFGFDGMRAISTHVGSMRKPSALLLAHALHNVPEGLAVGTALASPWPLAALPLLIGVSLHNLLDGLAVATTVEEWGWSSRKTVAVALLTALAEPIAAALGIGLIAAWHPLLPWVLLCTAGGMIEMVRTEILPQVRT